MIIFYNMNRIEERVTQGNICVCVCHKCYKIYLHLYVSSHCELLVYVCNHVNFVPFLSMAKIFLYYFSVFFLDRHSHKFLTREILYPSRYSFILFFCSMLLFDGFIGLFISFFFSMNISVSLVWMFICGK